MKLGLLGSTETHRGTRWAPNWAFAVREAWAGEFELSENHRGTRRPINFHHRGSIEDLKCKKTLEGHLAHPTTCATLLGRFQKILRPLAAVWSTP
ncbi:hypothetical protein E3N88_21094 [Mikania micrantha]|uniref:Uncharacterized protein n=1 Tax=Mikania micrantha TaxID=192012 RepID=A0A5N6NIW4_9ASTR|nr:hypothetical protein E3N88_21094 [Mikania micrantha]